MKINVVWAALISSGVTLGATVLVMNAFPSRPAFAQEQIGIFEADWRQARRVTDAEWLNRPWRERALERLSALLKSQR